MSDDGTKTASSKQLRGVRRWRLEVTSGPSRGLVHELDEGVVRVGSAPGNDVVIDDPKVSRHHLLLEVKKGGLRARDLGSKNGTFFQRSRIEVAELPQVGALLTVGESEVAIVPSGDETAPASSASARSQLGRLLGRSDAMRALFDQIERVARTTATVLVQGETGTGKELVAHALHEASERKAAPLVTVDCASIPAGLIESELFGHVRGAFTGANANRVGAFQRANGGTIFLDEIGELDPALQPRLLRVLETGEVKPVGASKPEHVDVRVVAATLRDLASEVRHERFREDLFYRLSVVKIEVPPLRARPGDVPFLVEHFVSELGSPSFGEESMQVLIEYGWPGNVRQLRNVVERAVAVAGGGVPVVARADLDETALPAAPVPAEVLARPYKEAKEAIVASFTKDYLESLLARHAGNVSAAAREAQVDRNWLVSLARKFGVRIRS